MTKMVAGTMVPCSFLHVLPFFILFPIPLPFIGPLSFASLQSSCLSLPSPSQSCCSHCRLSSYWSPQIVLGYAARPSLSLSFALVSFFFYQRHIFHTLSPKSPSWQLLKGKGQIASKHNLTSLHFLQNGGAYYYKSCKICL